MTLLVVVTGPPASGKTTIAERLADELSLPLIAKDEIKESLYDSLGVHSIEDSKRYGGAAFELMWVLLDRELRAGRSVIAEGNFNAARAEAIERLRSRYDVDALQIACSAPKEELLDRYTSRTRHPGHFDTERAEEIAPLLDPDLYVLSLDIPTIHLDTTRADAYDLARAFVLEREKTP